MHCTRTCSCRTQVPARVVHGFLHGLHDSHWVDSSPHRHPMVTTGSASAPTRPHARGKTPRQPSPLELRLLVLIRASGFEEPVTEHPFARHLGRRWRFDFAWPDRWLAVEVDGGAWVPGGGRHTRGAGFAADHDKFNRAMLLGWRVLRFTSRQLADGSALADLAEALGDQSRSMNAQVPVSG